MISNKKLLVIVICIDVILLLAVAYTTSFGSFRLFGGRLSGSGGAPVRAAQRVVQEPVKAGKAQTTTQEQRSDTPKVEIVSMPSPMYPGQTVTLFVRTVPGALCELELGYAGGVSEQTQLTPKEAGQSGLASWTWTVDAAAVYGLYPIKVTSFYKAGESATAERYISIDSQAQCKK